MENIQEPGNKKTSPTPWEALGIVWDLLFSIAVPVVLFALLGRWLDEKYAKSPIFTIIGLILALLVVVNIVKKKGKQIAKRL